MQNSPAEIGGLQSEDIIIQIGDYAINQDGSFINALFAYSPGETVTILAYRGRELASFIVTLGESVVEN